MLALIIVGLERIITHSIFQRINRVVEIHILPRKFKEPPPVPICRMSPPRCCTCPRSLYVPLLGRLDKRMSYLLRQFLPVHQLTPNCHHHCDDTEHTRNRPTVIVHHRFCPCPIELRLHKRPVKRNLVGLDSPTENFDHNLRVAAIREITPQIHRESHLRRYVVGEQGNHRERLVHVSHLQIDRRRITRLHTISSDKLLVRIDQMRSRTRAKRIWVPRNLFFISRARPWLVFLLSQSSCRKGFSRRSRKSIESPASPARSRQICYARIVLVSLRAT
jgi:hypothetical protein